MNNCKLIIFDFDGTLADTLPWFMANLNHAAKKFRFNEVQNHEVDSLRHFDSKRVMKHLDVSWWKLPFIASYMRKLMTKDLSGIELFDGVDDLLNELSRSGVQLALVSSNSHENVLSILGQDGPLFNYVECGVSMFGKKSKFRKIIKRSGFSRAEIMSIGDETRDIEAAKSERIHSGAVSWGYTKAESLHQFSPSVVFDEVTDILNVIQRATRAL